ncbi:MAG TPA: hypothetical protein VFH51_04560 [Myxococcota bacterium]|nr:hypothetical protein [Myxococcota bacterium]
MAKDTCWTQWVRCGALAASGLWGAAVGGCADEAVGPGDPGVSAEASGEAPLVASECDFDGTWAVKFVIPVGWGPSLVVDAGRGEVVQWAKLTRKQEGTTLVDSMQICGITNPDTVTRPVFGHEVYGITFPAALFDSGVLPATEVKSHVSGLTPGATYTTDPLTALLGLEMADAATTSWPEASEMKTVDADHDGKPGITVDTTKAPNYAAPPVNMWRSKRAKKFYIALRSVISGASGKFDSCDKGAGTATIPLIDGKAAINSRVLGCERTDGQDCAKGEYEMIDKQSSGYDLKGPAQMTMVRVGKDATCDSVRRAQF